MRHVKFVRLKYREVALIRTFLWFTFSPKNTTPSTYQLQLPSFPNLITNTVFYYFGFWLNENLQLRCFVDQIYFGASLTNGIFTLSQGLVHVQLGLLRHIQTNALGYWRSRGRVPVIKHSRPLEDLHNQTSSWITQFKCDIWNALCSAL